MKILFLDIDGVLNSLFYFSRLHNISVSSDDKIDLVAVKRLNQITDATGACIVVSSTWRFGYIHDLAGLQRFLAKQGVTAKVLGITPVDNNSRCSQIQDWMINSSLDISSFAILDDNDLGSHTLDKFLVMTTIQYGLQGVHVQKCIQILGAP